MCAPCGANLLLRICWQVGWQVLGLRQAFFFALFLPANFLGRLPRKPPCLQPLHSLLPNLLPWNPLSAPLGQMFPLRNQTLVNRTGQQGDAVPADLVAEVLAGDSEGTGTGWLQDIPVQVIPLFCVGQRISGGHISTASTPVLFTERGGVKRLRW